ncbi:hypothetical protein [Bradyrhizobium lablabi]|uniref:hypothetical protein n=1 Tax=Bradyrhizobium lablabi TaxID=722472 RepID=UPI001BAA041C|nr:hypothetical protein [Bradyrhizobium lablabi]MBR0698163.1 hypothetical protein [Bradyrhizobium lablabi]
MSIDSVWRNDLDALAFRPPGHAGFCVIHRRAFRALLGSEPSAQQSINFYQQYRDVFAAAALEKIARAQIEQTVNFNINSRDVRRQLKNFVAPPSVVR